MQISDTEPSRIEPSPPGTIPAEANSFELWQDPALSGQILHKLEEFAEGFKASLEQQGRIKSQINYSGQQMSEVFGAISQLLDILYERVVSPAAQARPAESLAPPVASLMEASDEMNRREQSTEEPQVTVLEATLRRWEIDRETERTAQLTQIETLKRQTRIELNRLLQVFLLAAASAAAGAGFAFYIMG